MTTWLDEFRRDLKAEAFGRAASRLQAEASPHGDAPSAAVLSEATEVAEQLIPKRSVKCAVDAFFRSKHPGALELAANLVPMCFPLSPKWVRDRIVRLAEDDNWEVREYAASAVGDIICQSFDTAMGMCLDLAQTSSPRVKRALAVGAKYAAKSRDPGWMDSLIELTGHLLADPDDYLRKNLGPFAIGDGLLRYYPDATYNALRQWSREPNEYVRWNVAMSQSTAEAARHLDLAAEILEPLIEDESNVVRRAAETAVRRQAKRLGRDVGRVAQTAQNKWRCPAFARALKSLS